ncbi:MAG: hypothetical protein ABIC40_04145, partial [bacterium]
MGIFDFTIDPDSANSVSITPVRSGSFHGNIRKFLENSPCKNCLTASDVEKTTKGFNINITITHPFGLTPSLCLFDVRGIVFFDGSRNFPESQVRISSVTKGDSYLANPDGYMTLYNPLDYKSNGLFGYSKGKLIPKNQPDPIVNLGAFKAFYPDEQSEDVGGRRAFYPGSSITKKYEIAVKPDYPLHFGYAVDACWEAPLDESPDGPEDFPITANCPEPFRLDVNQVENTLTSEGGSVVLEIYAFDHQGVDGLTDCSAEAPGLTENVIIVTNFEKIDDHVAKYVVEIPNELGSADIDGEDVLISVNHDEPDANLGLIPAWHYLVVSVADVPDYPVVEYLEPGSGYQGSKIDILIHGTGFKVGVQAELYKGLSVLKGYNVIVYNPFVMQTSFDLNGPLGFYTAYVENSDGKWGELKNAFEVNYPATGCSNALHTDTLGAGTIPGSFAPQYDSAFMTEGVLAGMMIATGEFPWGHAIVGVDADTVNPPNPTVCPGDLGDIGWKTVWCADVDENSGNLFLVWYEEPNVIEIYSPAGNFLDQFA